MARRRYNNVLILGTILLIIGGGLFLAGRKGATLRLFKRPNIVTTEQSRDKVFIIRDSEGEISGQFYAPVGREHINHNAADDPAFDGVESSAAAEGSAGGFLGMYDFNFLNALTIIFLAAGGLLLFVSNIRLQPKKRYY